MNKKLIKQLEGVGFEHCECKSYSSLMKEIKGHEYTYNYDTDNFYSFEGSVKKCDIYNVTFPQILAAIKEHTGVDLTKKTKREEIEELKVKVASLEDKSKALIDVFETTVEVPLKMIQDAIKSQNEAIENLKVSIKSRGRIETIETMQAKNRDPFGVDDKVVINENAKGLYGFQIEAMEQQIPLTITRLIGLKYQCEYEGSNLGVFPAEWLSYALEPKERERVEDKHADKKPFEVGDRVVLLCKAMAFVLWAFATY